MGNMHQWDVSNLINKLENFDKKLQDEKHTGYDFHEFKKTLNQFEKMDNFDIPTGEEEQKETTYAEDKSDTFLTTSKVAGKGASVLSDDEDKSHKDVYLLQRWKAHTDGITWVTFNKDPTFIATSSFDKNVYIWNDSGEKIGSLVLGHDKYWNIVIDKSDREKKEIEEAEEMLGHAEKKDDAGADGSGNNKERDLKIMEQLREFQRKKNIRKKHYYEY